MLQPENNTGTQHLSHDNIDMATQGYHTIQHHLFVLYDLFLHKYENIRESWFLKGRRRDSEIQSFIRNTGLTPDVMVNHIKRGFTKVEMSLSRQEWIAIILLLDQVPRHIFRGSPQSYKYDAIAKSIVKRAYHLRIHTYITIDELMFLVLPLMHSERLRDHELAHLMLDEYEIHQHVMGYPIRNDTYEGDVMKTTRYHLFEHTKVIQRFGRYPKRYKKNTAEEERYISQNTKRMY